MKKPYELISLKSPFLLIVFFFIVSRVLLLIVGLVRRDYVKYPSRMVDVTNEVQYYGKVGTLFHGWDSGWYLQIADKGYPAGIERNSNGTLRQSSYAFFPLYPSLSHMFATVLGINLVAVSIIVSNISLLLSGFLIYILTREKLGERFGLLVVKFLFLFPISYIYSAIQSESLFLCLFLAVFVALERKRFIIAGVAGYLLALTRSIGFLVFIPILYESLKFNRRIKKNCWGNWGGMLIATLLPILGILTFVFYSYARTGDPFIIFKIQEAWGKYLNFNPLVFLSSIDFYRNSYLTFVNGYFFLVILVCAVYGCRGWKIGYKFIVWIYCIIYLITTTQSWHIFSYPRFVSILFPAFFTFAVIAGNSKRNNMILTLVFIFTQIFMYSYWVNGFPMPI